MALFNHLFPYSNLHDINLDWIISIIKSIDPAVIQALQEHGVDKQTSKELFLYYLTTEDRQIQMLEWIKENADTCDSSSIIKEAQRILSGYLARNPYNILPKDAPIPKWTPKTSTIPQAKQSEGQTIKTSSESNTEDPFDKVLQTFFSKLES